MSSGYIKSVSLHEQEGSITMAEFAASHGFSEDFARKLAAKGRILGARQDSRSKKWSVYPPAKLLESERTYVRKAKPAEEKLTASVLDETQLTEPQPPAPAPGVYSDAKVEKICRLLRQETARRFADEHCLLRLSKQEFRLLYRAVAQERNRHRKAIGKRLARFYELRASDSLWEILQRINVRLS